MEGIITQFSEEDLTRIIKRSVEEILSELDTNKGHIDPNKRLTRNEVRDSYGMSFTTIHKYMKNGDLPFTKLGRKTLIRVDDIENLLSKNSKSI